MDVHSKPLSNSEQSEYEHDKAPLSMGRYIAEVDINGKTVVDFGCGWGGESVWLLDNGAGKVIGVDIEEDSLEQARRFGSGRDHLSFVKGLDGIESESVDFVFSTNVFEHVMDLPGVLDELKRILKPGGTLVSKFGPLFYSPYGCHFYWAKLFPWSHLIMGKKWLNRRIDKVRGYESTLDTWEDVGLNMVTYPEFARLIIDRFEVTRLRAVPVAGLPLVTRIPGLRRYLTFGCDMNVCKPA